MRVLVIADEERINFDDELRADLLISCGDLSDRFIARMAAMTLSREVFAVKGNHDTAEAFRSPIRDLHLAVHRFGGLAFGGFNGSWRYKSGGDFLYEQQEVEDLLREYPPVDVFVAHNSPAQVHEWDNRVHAGFTAFNAYIERARPQFFIHGHQHMNAECYIGDTRIIGVMGQRWIQIPGSPGTEN